MQKDFEGWSKFKNHLQQSQTAPLFKERDVWWCSIGINIGNEEDGKSDSFSRPVLIVKKFNRRIFLGVPLTTQIKETPHYHHIRFKEKEQCVMISQLRIWESKRLGRRMGQLTDPQFLNVKQVLRDMLN
jgi:mRNA interferase MazF